MIKSLHIENLTAFPSVNLGISRRLNVIVGENGTGKTHLLKLMYAVLAMSADEGRKPTAASPTKTMYQTRLAEKLINVFRPESLGRLARRRPGRERCDIGVRFLDRKLDIDFSFATNSKSEVMIERLPEKWISHSSAYIPTRELLSIYPNFVSIYEGHYLEFEETWRDTCILLGALLRRGPKEATVAKLLAPLEEAMGGTIELDKNGRFYLRIATGRMEMPLVAEGLRKLGMIARLVATGALLDNGCLFWDEPEANLNPRLTKTVAKTILDLSANGIQVFLATHSLFLLRELEILLADRSHGEISPCFIGLHRTRDGVQVMHGPSIDDIGDIASLDEEILQSDRFLEVAK